MELKDIYAILDGVENGATLIAGIKNALGKANSEAKELRTKYTNLLTAVGLDDTEDAISQAETLRTSIENLKATGKKPDEIATLVKTLEKKLDAMQESYNSEKAKRINQTKFNTALAALQEGGAVDAKSLSKLVLDNIIVKDDDTVVFQTSDGDEVAVKEGVESFLKANPWAVKNAAQPGAGTTPPANQPKSFTEEEIAKMTPDQINENWDVISNPTKTGGK